MVPRCLPDSSWLVPSSQSLLTLEDQVTPTTFGAVSILADASIKHLHPTFFVSSSVGIEVDDLAIVEANTEAFFNKHIPFFFFGEARFATLASLSTSLLLSKRSTIVNELGSIGKVDCGTGLSGRLMICSELVAGELEESTTPVLFIC